MIVDWNMCIRVADGDEAVARASVPYRCPECSMDPETYSGKVRFEGDPVPQCVDPDHKVPVSMVVVR
jgi:hypothetical protein